MESRFLRYIKNKYNIFDVTVFIIVSYIISQLLGIAFTGGDDVFIAVDYLEKDGMINAAIKQAIGQGRFFAIFTYYLAELTFYFGFEVTNFFKILFASLSIYLYYILIKKVTNKSFSLFNIIIFVMFFDWYGGDFNPYHNVTQWYNLGFIFLLISFICFINDIKNDKSSIYPAFFFFLSISFYEIFILYFVAFVFYLICKNFFTKKNLIKHFPKLLFSISIYLFLYVSFRLKYPSLYEGNKGLYFGDAFNSIFTIIRLSVLGVGAKYISYYSSATIIKSFLLSTFSICIFFYFVSKNKIQSKLNFKTLFFLFILVIIPNILFGFIQKYHSWFGYYVGSYFSSFVIIPIVASYFLWIKDTNKSIFILSSFFLYVVSVLIFLNYFERFDKFKVDRLKWNLIDKLINEKELKLTNKTLICTDNFFDRKSSYNVYPYWDKYIYSKIKIKPKIVYNSMFDKKDESHWPGYISEGCECDYFLNFQRLSAKTFSLSINNDSIMFRSIFQKENMFWF